MNSDGPQLESMMHRLSECPIEFIETCIAPGGLTQVFAIVSDHFRALGSANPMTAEGWSKNPFGQIAKSSNAPAANDLARYWGLIGVATWLLHDEWFRARPALGLKSWEWLNSDSLKELAEIIRPEHFVQDPDRREELVRLCLSTMDLRPLGESIEQALDRKQTLDSVERQRILRDTAEQERRAREVREAMAKKRAIESASRYGE